MLGVATKDVNDQMEGRASWNKDRRGHWTTTVDWTRFRVPLTPRKLKLNWESCKGKKYEKHMKMMLKKYMKSKTENAWEKE